MASTRFNDDILRLEKRNQESTDIGRWILNTPGNGVQPHYYEDPNIRLQKWGANLRDVHPMDVASDLDGRNRPASKYCSHKVYPYNSVGETHILYNYPTMNAYTQETRLTHPAWSYVDLPQHRISHLHFNPQKYTELDFNARINTRNMARDNYNKKL